MPRQAQFPWYPSQLTSVANGHDDFRCERTRRKQYAPRRRSIKIETVSEILSSSLGRDICRVQFAQNESMRHHFDKIFVPANEKILTGYDTFKSNIQCARRVTVRFRMITKNIYWWKFIWVQTIQTAFVITAGNVFVFIPLVFILTKIEFSLDETQSRRIGTDWYMGFLSWRAFKIQRNALICIGSND